jgi:hypothetical protein
MNIFDGIEKLITEHGSAAILKERLLLVADKYAALEKSLFDCQAKTKDAVSEKQHFELEGMKLKEELRRVNEQLFKIHENPLTSKYGVLWDKHGNAQCPKCKTTVNRVVWATHLRAQVQSLRCSCSKTPIVLMDAGQPIQAPDAMRLMANG